jgi:hypothetical protein
MKNIFSILLVFAVFQTAIFAARRGPDDVKPTALHNAALSVSARIYYGDEDEEQTPVSASFYLLRRSAVDILKSKNFQPVDERDKPLAGESDYLEAFARAVTDPEDESQLLALLIQNAIGENQIAAVKTDRLGFGKSKTVASGNYYLFGHAQINDEIFLWNFPVTLSAGRKRNRVEIDQHNAEVVVSV